MAKGICIWVFDFFPQSLTQIQRNLPPTELPAPSLLTTVPAQKAQPEVHSSVWGPKQSNTPRAQLRAPNNICVTCKTRWKVSSLSTSPHAPGAATQLLLRCLPLLFLSWPLCSSDSRGFWPLHIHEPACCGSPPSLWREFPSLLFPKYYTLSSYLMILTFFLLILPWESNHPVPDGTKECFDWQPSVVKGPSPLKPWAHSLGMPTQPLVKQGGGTRATFIQYSIP